jgi:uncharacterized surface protein with fasciclin (FAS1) repeats
MTTMRARAVCWLLLVVASTTQATRVPPRSNSAMTVGTRMAEMEATRVPGNASLKTLLEALNNATPALAEVLAGGQQAFTVFAPTDEVRVPFHLQSKPS